MFHACTSHTSIRTVFHGALYLREASPISIADKGNYFLALRFFTWRVSRFTSESRARSSRTRPGAIKNSIKNARKKA